MKKLITSLSFIVLFSLAGFGQLSLSLSYQGSPCDSGAWVYSTISGGISPYSLLYDWGDGSTSSSTLQGTTFDWQFHNYFITGTYIVNVSVSDGNGDTTSSSLVIIYNPAGITVTSNVQNSVCDPCGGSITLTPSGGQPPYFVSWSNGESGLSVNGLCDGIYTAWVYDSSQCSWTDTFIIDNTSSLDYAINDPTCNSSDGSIAIVVDSLASQYSYSWSTGSSDSVITNLSSGIYSVTVTGPCSFIDSILISDSCGTISGLIFEDDNGNGIQDFGEGVFSGAKITLLPDNIITFSDAGGNYSISVPDYGIYTIQINPPIYYINGCADSSFGFVQLPGTITSPISGSHTVNVTTINPVSTGNDFAVSPPDDNCGTISGQVFDDQNANGVQDPGEPGYANAHITTNIGGWAVTDANGNYTMDVPLNVTVTVSLVPGYSIYYCNSSSFSYTQTFPLASGSYTVNLTTVDPDTTGIDFGVSLSNPGYDVGVYSIWTTNNMSAGSLINMGMDFKATGSITTDCILRLEYDPLFTFISASVTPSAVGSDFVEWTYLVGTAPGWYCMLMTFELDSSAVSGTSLEFTAFYGCGGQDACAYNDTIVRDFNVVLGPLKTANGRNDMYSFLPKSEMPFSITAADSVFSFLISYQNTTGHDAGRLVIENPISDNLDISTLSFPFSLHAFEMTISENNTLLFEFDHIDIPDSSNNELMSYGFIQYNIEAKRNLPLGTTISNKAKVAWNGYDPEWTNEVQHKIETPGGLEENDQLDNTLHIFPNPASNHALIDLRSISEEVLEFQLYNILGETISGDIEINNKLGYINTEDLSPGVYVVQIETKYRSFSTRLVVK